MAPERLASDRLGRSAGFATGQRCAARPAPLDGELPPSVSRRSFVLARGSSGLPSLDLVYPLGPNRHVPTRNNHVCGSTTRERSAADESLSISSIPTAQPAWRN